MRTNFILQAFWRRTPPDPFDECARQLWRFIQAARWIDARLDGWVRRVASPRSPPPGDPLRSQEACVAAIHGAAFDGPDGAGSSLALENDQEGHGSATCDYLCGLHGDLPLRWAPNTLCVTLYARPRQFPVSDRATLGAPLCCAAEIFRPEWGVVGTPGFPAIDAAGDGRPAVGWLTYLSAELATSFPAVPGVEERPVVDRGTVLALAVDSFDATDEGHAERAAALSEALQGHGLLRPLVGLADRA